MYVLYVVDVVLMLCMYFFGAFFVAFSFIAYAICVFSSFKFIIVIVFFGVLLRFFSK